MSEETITKNLPDDIYPGFYGKLPSLGDFVTRRLPRGFVTPWETWLQEAMANSQEQLGEQWLDNYLTSPLWRFVLTAGICGESGWAGIVMPSVDRVGRYYPLTFAARLGSGQNPFHFLEQSETWFSRLEALALSCLDDSFQLDDLEQQLQSASLIPPLKESGLAMDDNGSDSSALNNAWHAKLETQTSIRSLYPDFLPQLMKKLLFAYSLWWTQGSERVAPSLLACQGLPHIKGAVGLIDGAWGQHGWEEIGGLGYALDLSPAEAAT